ncbi:hypothetical protein LOTGIDRAFT_108318 [Lottia gigantea]|uniref:Major facilitator superfamily (MFS) profile domain-containing protein n=1 Tax=Lottia gigantea TaxID=225164 RepID=V3ZSY0_LOTGI|nr:hypothetical protein LOTGIDRAFT_108318 [Lottia gigantea]ESO84001.1 hypothetical protein LOTGIDRAFT_108318 [Lottia gigantea]
MKYNEILLKLGDLGLYQKRLYFLTCLPALVIGLQAMLTIFILAIPSHRCQLPSEFLDTHYYPTNNVTQFYVNSTIPVDDGQWAECEQYDVGNLSTFKRMDVVNGNISRLKCNDWVYDTSTYHNTFVSEFNLVCDDTIYRSHANMLFMFGKMLGSLVFGIIADRFGRKKSFIISVLIDLFCSMAIAFSPSVWVFFILRMLVGAASSVLSFYTSGLELVGKSKRAFAGIVIEFFWVGGSFTLLVLAYLSRSWDDLLIATALPVLPFVITFWFIPASTRWLVSKGRTKEAEKILRKAAKVNKVELPDELFDKDCLEKEPRVKIWEMFTSPVLDRHTFLKILLWLGTSLTQDSIHWHLNFLLKGELELALPLIVFGICSVVAGLLALLTVTITGMKYSTFCQGRFGVSAAFAVIYIFSCELFPTEARNFGLGASSFLGRIGGIISPYIADMGFIVDGKVGKALPLIIFGSAAIAAGLLALLLPETKNRKLPETIKMQVSK